MPRSRGLVVVASVVLLLLEGACDSNRTAAKKMDGVPRRAKLQVTQATNPTERTSRMGWLEIRLRDVPPRSLLGLAPTDLLAARGATYRILPDRRILYAAAEIHRTLDGAPGRPVHVRFEGGAWVIGYGDDVVGRLSEIPTWEDSRTFLESWAARIIPSWKRPSKRINGSASGRLRSMLSEGSVAEVVSALTRLDALWKQSPGNEELLRLACGGLTWLQVQTHDPLERTDPLLGHALALLVLARNRGIDVTREEALLANEMGYGEAAAEAGRRLPKDDAVRFFTTRDDAGLQALAERTRNRRTEYFALLRLGEAGDSVVWEDYRARTHWSGVETSPVLHAAMSLGDFSRTTARGHALFQAAMRDAAIFPASAPALPIEARLKEFEGNLARTREQLGGPLFDGESAVSVTRANAYGGLFEILRFALDTWYVAEVARSFASALADPPAGTAEELVRWTGDRVAVREGIAAGRANALADLASFRGLGSKPLARLRVALRSSITSPVDPNLRRPIPGYFAGLDSRPSHLLEAGWAAWDNLMDIKRAERYLRAAVAMAPREAGGYLPWCAVRGADADELRRIADRKDVTAATRVLALENLAWLEGSRASDKTFLESRYRNLLTEGRENTAALYALVKLLEKRGQVNEANEVIKTFLANRSDNNDLRWAGVEARRSALLRKAGRPEEAWAVVEPTLATGKEDCLEEGARTLAALGKAREAASLAAQSLERYPESGSAAALVAELAWEAGAYAEAAKVLAAHDKGLTEDDWQSEIGGTFARVFEKKPVETATAAFDELRRVIPHPWRLGNVALTMGVRGGHEAAFRMLASLGGQGTEAMGLVLSAYGELVKARGAAEAVAWLKERLPAGDPGNSLLLASFQDGHYDLLWDLWDERRAPNVPVLQSLRGFALYLSRKESDPRGAALLTYWAADPMNDFAMGGRYLFGVGERDALFSKVKDAEDLAGAAWTIGLKAAREERFEEAAEWFQVALEVGNERMAPSAWAWRFLTNWRAKNVFFSSLAARHATLPFRMTGPGLLDEGEDAGSVSRAP